MRLRIVPVDADTASLWRDIHNAVITAHALSREEVLEHLTRNVLTLAYDADVLVGNATIRRPQPDSMIATVIVRILPEYRRRGLGSEYLVAMLAQARGLNPRLIETVVLASNEDGLSFAVRRGFVESGRYVLEGETAEYVELCLGRVLGVDGCKDGWIAVALGDDGVTGTYFADHIQVLVSAAEADGPVAAVAIDIPIGLPDAGYRRADVLARAALGTRWPSIFMTPVRQALAADDYATASARNRSVTGSGISRQAFGLRQKILQVDHWVRSSPVRVVESHPELCFARLAGAPLAVRKSTWEGARLRCELLAGVGIKLPPDLGTAGAHAAVDDVLDAAAAAWAARRVIRGAATAFPDPPEIFSDGWPCAIWA